MEIPFLTSLGIDQAAQGRAPSAHAFPKRFNPNAYSTWVSVVQELKPSKNVALDWGRAIRNFVEHCESHGVYPFLDKLTNDTIFEFLRAKRHAIVDFIDRIGLYKELKVRDVVRRVTMTTTGFELEVYGIARLADPSFPHWLKTLRFIGRDTKASYLSRQVEHGLTFFATNERAIDMSESRWHVGYIINCPSYPEIPGKAAASKAELEKFILDVLWEPAFRMRRPLGIRHRLI